MARTTPFLPFEITPDNLRRVITILQAFIHSDDHDHTNTDGSGALDTPMLKVRSGDPATPPGGYVYFYAKTSGGTGRIFSKGDDGVVHGPF
jgi:hypothetical protein